MVATRIGSMRMVICASPALLETHGVPQKPKDLQRMPWVTFEGPTPLPARQIQPPGSGTTTEFAAASRLSVSTAEAAVEAAVRNVGVTRLLHYQVADAVESGALRIVLQSFEPEPAPIHLVHAASGQMPLKMRRFLDFAAPRLRQAVGRIGSAANG
jgi:DNA-binding transcriptional LysR family regulator